jgi:imidazolonepropionase
VKRKTADLLIKNANELVTLKGESKRPLIGKQMEELGIIKDGAVAVKDGRILAVGKTGDISKQFRAEETIDAVGRLVVPGFVDPHTHLVFAGSREDEFELRLKGVSYMEILRKGGGILKTVEATRQANEQELVEDGMKTLNIMLACGTTTVEAKSGYGLTLKDELKCLKVAKELNEKHPIDVVPTFLGAHAVPAELKGNTDGYVDTIIDTMIPKVAKQRLAEFCDVFCENDVFNIEQSRRILVKAKEHGLKPKVHADEMTPFGGAELAAEVDAVSAEHLLFASENGLRMMARKGVTAVLLPAAAFSLMTAKYADARKMIDLGVPVAMGTDFNPSCWVENQQLIIALACRQMQMTPAEALVAVTINAAHAINRANEVGSLEVGKKADVVVLDVSDYRFLGYRFGVNLVEKVVKEGKLVFDSESNIKPH